MATMMNPLAVQRAPRVGRVTRGPTHRWNVKHKPWQLQPCFIAPVIPGETLKNAVLQARVVTDPVKNRLIGWWHEYYVYYVPFRALSIFPELEKMILNPDWTPDAIDSNTAVAAHYFAGRNSIDFVKHCLDAVVAYDFRKQVPEGESQAVHTIDGLPIASINNENWTNSLINDDAMELFDVPVEDLDADGQLEASEVDFALKQWQMLRDNGLTEMSYQDYLKTYGIKGQAVREPKEEWTPELLRYIRDWQYPSNTVDAAGAVNSAVSWSIAERLDKDRFFREPGFIFGMTVTRPKIYLGNQVGAAVMMLDHIKTWLPAVLRDDPYTSLVKFENGEGPMLTGFADTAPALSDATPTQAYWVDVRDLFLYGDQFLRNPTAYTASLPAKDGNMEYATAAEYPKLFVDQTGDKQHTEQDGLITFSILGTQPDHTEKASSRVVV